MKNKSVRFYNIIIFCILPFVFGFLNALLSLFTKVIKTPLFLDSIFTAISSLLTGFIPGLLTALWTHFFMEVFDGFSGLCYPWVLVSIGTVISMRLIIKITDKINIALVLNATLLTTLMNATLGAIVSVTLYGGLTEHPSDSFVSGFIMFGQNIFSASFWARIPINLIDKGIAVGIAFLLYYLINRSSKSKISVVKGYIKIK